MSDDAATWDDAYRQPAQSLAIFRMLFGVALLGLLLPRFQWVAGFPDDFFDPPPGPTWFFAGFPPRGYFVAVDTVLITSTVFLISGRLAGFVSYSITAALLAGNAWAYSFGKTDHDILLVILPAFMAAAGWNGRGPSRAWPLASLALVISLTMAVSAWEKAASGWLDPSASAVLGHNVVFSSDSDAWLWRAALKHLPHAGWKLLDYCTLAFESAFILVVFRASAFRVLCGVACVFHVVVGQMMHITFLSNLPAYAAFVDWEDLTARIGLATPITRLQRWLADRRAWQLTFTSAAISIIYLRWGNAIRLATTMLGPAHELIPRMMVLWMAMAFAAILLVARLRRS